MLNAQLELPQQSINYQDPQDVQMVLQFELKKALLYGPSLGVYLLPSLDDTNIWNGIIFVRHGYYKEGKFKFNISFQEFPNKPPSVCFLSKVYHPLVNFSTGELDISALLSTEWIYPDEAMLYNLVTNLHKMFSSQQYLTERSSYNSQAAKLYAQNRSDFALQTIQNVEESLVSLQMEIAGSSLSLQTIPKADNQLIRRELEEACSGEGEIDDKIDRFMEAILQ